MGESPRTQLEETQAALQESHWTWQSNGKKAERIKTDILRSHSSSMTKFVQGDRGVVMGMFSRTEFIPFGFSQKTGKRNKFRCTPDSQLTGYERDDG